MAEIKLQKMRHVDTEQLADVHPEEVENYRAAGFVAIYDEDDAEAQANVSKRKGK